MSHPHQRLKAYQFALRFHRQVISITRRLPTGFANLSDQLRRASRSICLNIAEGGSAWTKPNKCKYFRIALASAGECSAALDLFEIEHTISSSDLDSARSDLEALSALTVGLIRKH